MERTKQWKLRGKPRKCGGMWRIREWRVWRENCVGSRGLTRPGRHEEARNVLMTCGCRAGCAEQVLFLTRQNQPALPLQEWLVCSLSRCGATRVGQQLSCVMCGVLPAVVLLRRASGPSLYWYIPGMYFFNSIIRIPDTVYSFICTS